LILNTNTSEAIDVSKKKWAKDPNTTSSFGPSLS